MDPITLMCFLLDRDTLSWMPGVKITLTIFCVINCNLKYLLDYNILYNSKGTSLILKFFVVVVAINQVLKLVIMHVPW